MTDERECAYLAVAEELSEPTMTLDDLDVAVVKQAREWSVEHELAWPPAPITTGWQMTVWSLR